MPANPLRACNSIWPFPVSAKRTVLPLWLTTSAVTKFMAGEPVKEGRKAVVGRRVDDVRTANESAVLSDAFMAHNHAQ